MGRSGKKRTGRNALDTVAKLISAGKGERAAIPKNIVVLTGAGISTSAGIPDFRSPETGLYHNLARLKLPFPEAVFELGYFQQNPKPFWTLAKELYPGKHHPTPTHYFLKLLEQHGALTRVFTQNIDTLELQTGLSAEKIIEAHGSFASAHCLKCRAEASTEYVLKSGVREGTVVRCGEKGCNGLVKPDIVFFGEGLPERFFKNMKDLKQCDLLIVIGTSLQVQPFASLPDRCASHVPRLLINREAVGDFSSLDDSDDDDNSTSAYMRKFARGGRSTDLFWKGDADDGVRALCAELGWETELDDLIAEGKREMKEKWRDPKDNPEDNDTDDADAEHTSKELAQEIEEVSGRSHTPESSEEDAAELTNQPGSEAKEDADEVEALQRAIQHDLKLVS